MGDRHFVMQKAPFYDRYLQPGIDSAIGRLGKNAMQLYEQCQAMSVAEATEFVRELMTLE